jgi:hypothetical protein
MGEYTANRNKRQVKLTKIHIRCKKFFLPDNRYTVEMSAPTGIGFLGGKE